MRLTNHSHRKKPPSQKSFTKLTMVATISLGWVPLVMVIFISNAEELYNSTKRTTIVATIVLTIVPIEVGHSLTRYINVPKHPILSSDIVIFEGCIKRSVLLFLENLETKLFGVIIVYDKFRIFETSDRSFKMLMLTTDLC